MNYKSYFILLALTFSIPIWLDTTLPAQEADEAQEWVSVDGKSVSGQFVRLDGKTLVIRLQSGREAKVALSSLSLESHLQALKLAKPEAFTKEAIKAPEVVEAVTPQEIVEVGSILDSPFGEDPSIDRFLSTYASEWKNGNHFVVWHTLPPKMQQDLTVLIGETMGSLGPAGRELVRKNVGSLASLASGKRDWILDSPLKPLFPVMGDPSDIEKNWPVMVGMLQKLSEQEVWDAKNFESDGVVPWLAEMSTLVSYAKEMIPELNHLQYSVVSQSADRAEVEFTGPDGSQQTIEYQKLGNIWVNPVEMNQLRAAVDQELSQRTVSQTLNTMVGGLALFGPTLNKLSQAKTKAEFDQTIEQSGLKRILGSIPSLPTGQIGGGMPGLPGGIPSGISGGLPGMSGVP